jgi:hypothetical protein
MRRNNIGPRGAEQWPICRRTLQRLSASSSHRIIVGNPRNT